MHLIFLPPHKSMQQFTFLSVFNLQWCTLKGVHILVDGLCPLQYLGSSKQMLICLF